MAGGTVRALGGDWLSGISGALRWIPRSFDDPAARRAQVARALERRTHPDVLAALRDDGHLSIQAERNLNRLERGRAVVVVTGQQAGLLLGPLYTFHKVLSAVSMAELLAEETGVPAVPVFWLQDEDHDFAEVAAVRWLDSAGSLREETLNDEEPRVPVGERTVSPQLSNICGQIETSLHGTPYHAELQSFLEPWGSGRPWSSCFVASISRLFSEEGLLVLRGRNPRLAAAARPFHRRAISEALVVGRELEERASGIFQSGYRIQVPIRPNCSLSFVHPDGAGGPRYRPRVDGDGFQLAGRPGRMSRRKLLERLDGKPRSFSSSALLRPVLQDAWFPVAVQVVGPGEAAYLAQIEPLRRRFQVDEPIIAPRGRALWLEPFVRRRLQALGARPADVLGDPTTFVAQRASIDPSLSPEHLRATLIDPLESALQALGQLDPDLAAARHRTMASVRTNLNRFIGRVAKQQAVSDADTARRVAEIRHRLLPRGHPQERFLGLSDLIARHGVQRLKVCFRDAYRAFSTDLMELCP